MVKDVALLQQLPQYNQLDIHFDSNNNALWYYMKASPRPCFTIDLLNEISAFQNSVRNRAKEETPEFLVLASAIPDIFNLGGDLNLFKMLIRNKDRKGLTEYAQLCIKVLYENKINLGLSLTTIGLVKGSALGGGLEAALSCDVLIAEKGVKMGFPEILFNLFPGMGAYSLLTRKLDAYRAEKLIVSGKLYDATELYELGVVDLLAEKGQGESMVEEYIKRHNKFSNGFNGIRRVKERISPLTFGELSDITDIWVATALKLEEKDIKMMDRLVRSQDRLYQTVALSRENERTETQNADSTGTAGHTYTHSPSQKRQPYLHSVRAGNTRNS